MANDEYSSGGDSHKLAKELQSLPEVERVEVCKTYYYPNDFYLLLCFNS